MNSPKSPTQLPELAMPSRIEGLLSLLVASPMSLLGCTPELLPADTEGSSSGEPMGGSSSSGTPSDSTSTSTPIPTDDTTSTGSTSSTSEPVTSTTDVSTSSSSTTESSTSEGGESTSTGGEQGNTCERVGDLMDMCFFGYGYWYEYSCNYYINDAIAEGDVECAQLWNEFYACVADLECAEVNMGIYEACETQWDAATDACWNFGGTDSFGEDSGFAFIVPETSGWSDGGWASDSGGWASGSGGWASDGGGGWTSTSGGGWGSSD